MRRNPARTRVLNTVLFTDIVGSTELASRLGDGRWRAILSRHHDLIRKELKRSGGREVDTAGDGFFAVFERPAEAIRCAAAIAEGVHRLGIQVRAGLHMGECEIMGRKVGGIAVHIGARVLGAAEPGEILVSGTLRELVAGADLNFVDRGIHDFKGVSGEWRLYALRQEERAPPPPIIDLVEVSSGWRWRRPAMLVAAATIAVVVVALTLAALDDDSVLVTANSVALIDAGSNTATGSVTVGRSPDAIAVSAGDVWVANFADRTVSRIDRETNEDVTLGGIGVPTDMAVGEGGVWVAAEFPDDTLYFIDPRTNQVDQIPGAGGNAVAVGLDAVWVVNRAANSIVRVDPQTHDIEPIRLQDDSGAAAVTTWGDAVWVANSLAESVTKIDPATMTTVGEFALGWSPMDIAAGPSGVWVTGANNDAVARIEPRGLTIGVGDAPEGIAVTRDGVWVANSRGASIWRLDPESGDVVAQIDVQGSPRRIVVADGTVWATVAAND